MPSTPIYGLPYPVAADSPNGPAQIQALAVAVEAALQSAVAAVAAVPTGTIAPYGGAAAPAGWRLCDGAAVSRTTFAALFAIVGTSFGPGDGSTTFNLPNLRGSVPTGLDAAQTEFNARGKTGGTKTRTLAIENLPSHKHGGGVHAHTVYDPGHGHGVNDPWHWHGSANAHEFANALTGTVNTAAGSGRQSVTGLMSNTGSAPTGITIAAGGTGIGIYNSAETIGAEGGGVATPILQPYVVTEFMIKT